MDNWDPRRTRRGHRSAPTPQAPQRYRPAGRLPPVHAPCADLAGRGAPAPLSTCIRCTWCDGYPCLVHAKADAEVIAVRPLPGRPNVTLLTGAEVTRLETESPGGRSPQSSSPATATTRSTGATSIGRLRRGRQQRQAAAQLGHRQAPERAGQRLGPGGRNYMFHNCKAIAALSKETQQHRLPEDARHQRLLPRHQGLRVPAEQHPDVGKSNAEAMRGEQPAHLVRHRVEPDRRPAQHSVDFWLHSEDLPVPENRVTTAKTAPST